MFRYLEQVLRPPEQVCRYLVPDTRYQIPEQVLKCSEHRTVQTLLSVALFGTDGILAAGTHDAWPAQRVEGLLKLRMETIS